MKYFASDVVRFVRANRNYLKTISQIESPYECSVLKRHACQGRIKVIDAIYLARHLRSERPSSILEVGSFLGFSAYWMLQTSESWGAKVTAVDPNIRHRVFDNPRATVECLNRGFSDRIRIESAFLGSYTDDVYFDYDHCEPKLDHNTVDIMLSMIPSLTDIKEQFDLIFIDGEHSYRATMENFRICVKSLNPGGTIIFHDVITWPDVGRVLSDLKDEFGLSARVQILGRYLPRLCDGLGLFKLLNPIAV